MPCRLVLACSMALLLTGATSYQVNNGSNQDIDEWGTCKNVDNNHASGSALFVPTATSTEWSAFYNNSPPGVTVSDCNSCSVTPGSQSFTTAGSFNFTVPCYNTLTVKVWGGGGGGSGFYSGYGAGAAGGQSKFNNALVANGGSGAAASNAGGSGGSASGGSTNTTGGAGETGGSTYGGKGGDAPSGGAGGPRTSSSDYSGNAGSAPGGGGSGFFFASTIRGGGGGSGGYSTKTYSAGDLTVGASLPVVVGAKGTGGKDGNQMEGGDGAVGRVTITWD